jgi:hypothetical protein
MRKLETYIVTTSNRSHSYTVTKGIEWYSDDCDIMAITTTFKATIAVREIYIEGLRN